MDGSGYPSRLKGDEIPEQSRIITIADVFEALTGKRPYRASVAPGKAFAILRKMPLDHLIVDVLENHYAERREFKNPKWVLSFKMNEVD